MIKDKNKLTMRQGDYVLYKGKVWKFEKQMSGHINLRNTKGVLISVNAQETEYHNGPTAADMAGSEAAKTAKSGVITTAAPEPVEKTVVAESTTIEPVKKKEQSEKKIDKLVIYKGKLWRFISQDGDDVVLRNSKGQFIDVKIDEIEFRKSGE